MKKCFFFMQGILLSLLFCQAQDINIRPLTIGDTVPDIAFNNVINYHSPEIKLSDFKERFVILDFWSTWCGACIEAFPHMDSMQNRFGEKIKVILVNTKVTRDSEDKIRTFLQKYRIRTGLEVIFPVIAKDTLLDSMFPHHAIPHYIWIDSNRIVRAITNSDEVSASNILSMLRGENKVLHSKENRVHYDLEKPLFVKGNVGEGEADLFLGRSILTGWKDGEVAGTGQRRNEANKITGFFMFDKSLLTLLGSGYGGYRFQKNRLFLEVNHPLVIEAPPGENAFQYLYCYDLSIPPSSFEEMQKYIREDIERYFHITVEKKLRKVKCLVARSTDGLKKSFTHYTTPKAEIERRTLHKYFRDYPITQILQTLDDDFGIPLVDETKSSQPIDLELPFDLSDANSLMEALRKAGFDLREEERDLEMTVISEKQN